MTDVGLVASKVPSAEVRHRTNGSHSLPSFFIVGPPRTGTSWLYQVLNGHVLVPAPTKETRFFDDHFHRGLDWYRYHFPRATTAQVMGEIAPTYFSSVAARERIRQTIPRAQIVCVFRNPLQRVLSLYRLKRAYGLIHWNFEQALEHDPELLASGRYATHLKAWQTDFGRDHVLATIYEDLRDCSQNFVDSLLTFIGAPRLVLTQSQISRIHSSETMTQPRSYYWTRTVLATAGWLKARRFDRVVAAVRKSPVRKLLLGGGASFTGLSTDMAAQVCNLFRREVEELEAILDRDLSAWKSVEI